MKEHLKNIAVGAAPIVAMSAVLTLIVSAIGGSRPAQIVAFILFGGVTILFLWVLGDAIRTTLKQTRKDG